MDSYIEVRPSIQLAQTVECYWTSRAHGQTHRVVPDGCADFVYTREGNTSNLLFVGPMTRFQDMNHSAESVSVGVRFRPGMWSHSAKLPGQRATDLVVPLEELWDSAARSLHRQLDDAPVGEQCMTVFDSHLGPLRERTPVHAAINLLEQAHGQISVAALASMSGLSLRQFRRRCELLTGLGPKLLARILRFRRADALSYSYRGRLAELAAHTGYADQSHLIRDVREFAGRSLLVNRER